MVKGRRPKLFYATQVGVAPPTFVFFARDAGSVHFSYRRYLENRLREEFGFLGTPVRLVFRERATVREPRRGGRKGGVRASGRAAGRPTGGSKPPLPSSKIVKVPSKTGKRPARKPAR